MGGKKLEIFVLNNKAMKRGLLPALSHCSNGEELYFMF